MSTSRGEAQTHIEEPASRDRVLQAIASWQQDSAEEADRTVTSHAPKGKPVVAGPTQEPALPPSPLSVNQSPAEVGFESLADRRAGVQARAQADAPRRAAPVRTILARLFGIHTEAWAWSKGARGEEKVGAQLAKLADRDPRWRVLHSIPVGHRGSDIDRLVIGALAVSTPSTPNTTAARRSGSVATRSSSTDSAYRTCATAATRHSEPPSCSLRRSTTRRRHSCDRPRRRPRRRHQDAARRRPCRRPGSAGELAAKAPRNTRRSDHRGSIRGRLPVDHLAGALARSVPVALCSIPVSPLVSR